MTPHHPDPDRVLEDWLAEGPSQLPDHAIDRIVGEVDQTRQRKPVRLLRRDSMNRTFLALGAATVAVAALAGAVLLSQVADRGGASPTLSVPASPSASPSAARPSATATRLPLSQEGLAAGTYRVTQEAAVPVQVTIPDGWSSFGGWAILRDLGGDFATAGLSFWSPSQATTIYAHPCRWRDEVPAAVESTPSAVAEALADQPLRGDAEPEDVTVDGYAGKRIVISLPEDLDFSTCDEGQPQTWVGRGHQAPGQVDEIYVIDVDGELLVFDISYMPDTPRWVRAELDAMVASLVVEGG